MRLLVDGDGCPVVGETIEIGKQFGVEVIIFCDTSHHIEREGATTVLIQKGLDAVDFAITNKVQYGDIVITQDFGLAAMVLAKRGYAINQSGFIYTENNIDQLLFRRHIVKAARKTGTRLKGPKKRTHEDNLRFKQELTRLCEKVISPNKKMC